MNNENNDKLLRLKQVLQLVRVSRSTWLSGVKEGRFPSAFKNGKCVFWKESEVLKFIDGVVERNIDKPDLALIQNQEIRQLNQKIKELEQTIEHLSKRLSKNDDLQSSVDSETRLKAANALYDWAKKNYNKLTGVHVEKRYLMQCGPTIVRNSDILDAAIAYLISKKQVQVWKKMGIVLISFF